LDCKSNYNFLNTKYLHQQKTKKTLQTGNPFKTRL
jgi:hypothetical protein